MWRDAFAAKCVSTVAYLSVALALMLGGLGHLRADEDIATDLPVMRPLPIQ